MDIASVEPEETVTIAAPGSMNQFFKCATRRPLLTALEEADLGRQIRNGDKSALHRLVESNLRLVVSIAARYASPRMPLEDLVQEGCLGLIRAAEKFDERKGHRFSTYATWWIWQAVTRAIGEQSRTIRIPLEAQGIIRRVYSVGERLSQELGRAPTTHEIADVLGESEPRIAELLQAEREPLSLELPLADESARLADVVADEFGQNPMETLESLIRKEEVEEVLECLTVRERDILIRRFGLDGAPPRTLSEVAAGFRLTRERVRQIEAGALRKLRDRSPSYAEPL
ncbi:MAG: RNA polymerase sigma factor RpoD/SigA [Armatimonadetes bacterium]|nr:RNA polymerase sigma factor RpoD/SigA [Armatimonadota bacterium]